MDELIINDLLREALWLTIKIIVILITPSLIVGLIVAILQTITQINEQTLSFLPRLISILLTIIIFSSWVLKEIINYTNTLINNIPLIIG